MGAAWTDEGWKEYLRKREAELTATEEDYSSKEKEDASVDNTEQLNKEN